MTGPEHYTAGNKVLARLTGEDRNSQYYQSQVLLAQAHFTAAAAAATAMASAPGGMPQRDRLAWYAVAGAKEWEGPDAHG